MEEEHSQINGIKIHIPEIKGKKTNLTAVLDYINESKLNDKNTIEDLIQKGTYDDFRGHLITINALFRGLDPEKHTLDGEEVFVMDELVPISAEYKEGILESAFVALKKMTPKDRGILMFNLIGTLHLFADGNGRSMRLWHHMLKGEAIDEVSAKTLTEHDNVEGLDMAINGRVEMKNFLNVNIFYTSGITNLWAFESELNELDVNDIRPEFPCISPVLDEEAKKNLSVKEISRLKNICQNETGCRYCPSNIMTIYKLSQEDPTFQCQSFSKENGVYLYNNEKRNDEKFTANQAKRFLKISDELKMRQLKTLINIFENPENYILSNGEYLKTKFY